MEVNTGGYLPRREFLAIISRNRVVHELIADEARSAELAINRVRRD